MGGTGLMRESPAALRFAVHWVMAPIAVLTTAFLPNGNFRTLKKSAIDLLNASFEEETLGKHPKAVYLNGSAIADPRFVHFKVMVPCLRPKLEDVLQDNNVPLLLRHV